MPNELRLHYQEIDLMDSPSSTKTRAALPGLYIKTEQSICEDLIEHYVLVQNESSESLSTINNTIQQQLKHKKPKKSAKYKAFLHKIERSEDDFRSLLCERRNKKLLQLSPHTNTRGREVFLLTMCSCSS